MGIGDLGGISKDVGPFIGEDGEDHWWIAIC